MSALEGKVAVVTGGASGIGRATAIAMAAAGARVVVTDINGTGADDVAAEIEGASGQAIAFKVDVSEPDELRQMVDRATDHYGRIDVLDNNAADLSLLQYDHDLLNTEPDVWENTYRANQQSVMFACKFALPGMIERGGGAIINISSVDGLLGETTRFAYGMSKAAVNVLTYNIAATYGPQGIRCNAILPGLIMTKMAKQSLAADSEAEKAWRANIRADHLGSTDEVASVAVFLASDAASYVNGELIRVDGGLCGHVPHLASMEALGAQ